jgi:hypothetical protein
MAKSTIRVGQICRLGVSENGNPGETLINCSCSSASGSERESWTLQMGDAQAVISKLLCRILFSPVSVDARNAKLTPSN